MEKETYNNWSDTKYIKDIITNPLITAGNKSYYSGFYSNHSFENGCVRYLWGDETTVDLFNPKEQFGWELDHLEIGNYVCIASGATILLGGNHNHRSDWVSVYPFPQTIQKSFKNKGDTIIKSDAWIGMNATIMPGVTIGEGAIIAAESVVIKNVEPYTVVAGNPAKKIKNRFTDEEINLLLELRWFDWSDEEVEKAIPLIMSQNIKGLYDYYLKYIK
ncbi:CatB-related O-acetyltransferase [Vagococcus fluvialis]|jgi:chloramphenicol O-acetyltransferase type B|uniref:CatB-related O-acetyltransferase n=1 Tax=Vagococcus fluvialis TaxID=2738 RepID=UPI001A8EFCEC|nr:CatB-related O-acetyltransferase [Vagococcus fluvialis]MBO0429505.1 CatB-related O-acetyltransferase [Vagococcus fluvialis]